MSEEKERQSLAYWSGRADEYSRLHMDSYASDRRMLFAEQVAMSMPTGEADQVVEALDLGCGSGFMSLLLLDAGCRVTGVDFSEDMLARARENAARKGYEARFVHMRAQQLDFPDNSFDVTVFVRRIRRKIEADPSNPRYLITKWGEGYAFYPEGE